MRGLVSYVVQAGSAGLDVAMQSVTDLEIFDNLSRLKFWMCTTQPAAQRDVSL